nr:MAG TPA: hypothetical protein [Crassvirales sp.]
MLCTLFIPLSINSIKPLSINRFVLQKFSVE